MKKRKGRVIDFKFGLKEIYKKENLFKFKDLLFLPGILNNSFTTWHVCIREGVMCSFHCKLLRPYNNLFISYMGIDDVVNKDETTISDEELFTLVNSNLLSLRKIAKEMGIKLVYCTKVILVDIPGQKEENRLINLPKFQDILLRSEGCIEKESELIWDTNIV